MKKILAKELKLKFVEILSKIPSFSYKDGNPFMISIHGSEYFVFLKNTSPAYFVNSPDVTRVQLPFSDHFKTILTLGKPFIILGFDVENDVFVGWNPDIIKNRLNFKQNVSLYSRLSFQSNVNPNEFYIGFLSNNEKIILFNRQLLPDYFEKIDTIFINSAPKINLSQNISPSVITKLITIDDPSILDTIKPLLLKNRLLECIGICNKNYAQKYPEMTFRDWYKIVNELYSKFQE